MTGHFLDDRGNWTPDCAQARNFGDVMAVILAATQLRPAVRQLEQVVMVERRPSNLDIHLPLRVGKSLPASFPPKAVLS